MTASTRLEFASPIAELILNKPEKRNALSLDMWASIPELIDAAVSATDIKIVIIHGGSAGAFAAGADISEFERTYSTPESARQAGETIAAALNAVEACPKPTIAAIDGACVGGGVSLAMACDLRVASQTAKFGVTPGKLGLVYPAGDTRRLLAAIGPGAAKDILFTGRIFSALEAEKISLIDRLVDKDSALDAAHEWASEIAAISQWSVRAIKRMIKGLQSGWADDDPQAVQLFLDGFSNEDFQDGYKAFLEKRAPHFPVK
ncbi:MAG: enoyl-CoA hydratase-related protein [Pseudomonadota bacterium]